MVDGQAAVRFECAAAIRPGAEATAQMPDEAALGADPEGLTRSVVPVRGVVEDQDERAIGLDDQVGSLTPGKQADILLLKTNAINTAPMVDPIGTIVVFADTSNVDSVFVAGRAVKRNGELVGADLESVFAKLDESRNHVLGEGELLPEWAAEPAAAV